MIHTDPLDALPDDGLDAAAILEQLAGISHRAGLLRMERRLLALGKWATSIAMADAELLNDQAEQETRDRVARTEALGREVLATAAAPVAAVPPLRAKNVQPPHPNLNADRVDAILAALAKGPLATREVASIVGGQRLIIKQALQRMAKAGTIEGIGHGRARRWWIPAAAAEPAPAEKRTLADVVAAEPGGGPACKRCDCGFSDHDPDTGKCYGKKGKCVCQEFYR